MRSKPSFHFGTLGTASALGAFVLALQVRYRRCRRFAGSTPHQSTALLKMIACLLSPQPFGLCRNITSSPRFLKDAYRIFENRGAVAPRASAPYKPSPPIIKGG